MIYAPSYRPCEGCVFLTIRDYGYGSHERHDYYCDRRCEWSPRGCDDKQDEDENLR